jgi:asparagine synthase (glutamine-hydrolysing)
MNSIELLEALFREYGHRFIDHVKGHFNIIQLMPDKFRVYSDHFGIKKYFYWKKNGQFIISNDLNTLSKLTRLTPSSLGMSVYALAYHFTGGLTAFEDTYHNQPAEYMEYHDNRLEGRSYWHPQALLEVPGRSVTIEDISESLKDAVQSTFHQNERISLSLTGGADTRNLLSIFLSIGVSPHLYTYGNPHSNDCVKAAAIAEGLGLEHQIHDIRMTAENFEDMARKIIRHGGGLASIHRAHRVMAVERESRHAKQMYMGTLGGEFIKGVSEDDYIVPGIVYENWNKTLSRTGDLEKYLDIKRIVADNDLKENLVSYLGTEPFLKGSDTNLGTQILEISD